MSFIIKTFNEEHTCQHVRRNKTATPTWIAKKLVSVLKYDPDMKIEAMRGQLLDLYGMDVEQLRYYYGPLCWNLLFFWNVNDASNYHYQWNFLFFWNATDARNYYNQWNFLFFWNANDASNYHYFFGTFYFFGM